MHSGYSLHISGLGSGTNGGQPALENRLTLALPTVVFSPCWFRTRRHVYQVALTLNGLTGDLPLAELGFPKGFGGPPSHRVSPGNRRPHPASRICANQQIRWETHVIGPVNATASAA